jgi:transposase InsO family protein
VHLLRKKNQVFDVFKAFKANIERSSDAKIITLRADNDDEYINQKFQNYLAAEDINWNPRASYVPEQNDEAERLNRTLMYKIRPMLNQTKNSRRMWNEIIKTIAYLSNRSSHYQLNDKTPYEMIKSKKPDLSHLRIIESTT